MHIYIYHFCPKEKKLEKVEKLVCRIGDKEKYILHKRASKQALNHGLVLKRMHRVIQFNQKAWLKPYFDMNTKKKNKISKKKFKKIFLS